MLSYRDSDGSNRTVSATNPLPTTGGGSVTGVYRATPPTLNDGQTTQLQLDNRANLEVSLWNGAVPVGYLPDNGDATSASGTARGIVAATLNRVFNGSTWDRLRGTVAGLWLDRTSIFTETSTALAASATLNGASRDTGAVAGGIGTRFKNFVAEVFTDQAGTLFIDKSTDGTTWRQAATLAVTAGVNATLEVKITCRYYRLRYVNGATLQTVFLPTTALTS